MTLAAEYDAFMNPLPRKNRASTGHSLRIARNPFIAFKEFKEMIK
jgi:hypothetical protein